MQTRFTLALIVTVAVCSAVIDARTRGPVGGLRGKIGADGTLAVISGGGGVNCDTFSLTEDVISTAGSCATTVVHAPASGLTGTTIASGVTVSSLVRGGATWLIGATTATAPSAQIEADGTDVVVAAVFHGLATNDEGAFVMYGPINGVSPFKAGVVATTIARAGATNGVAALNNHVGWYDGRGVYHDDIQYVIWGHNGMCLGHCDTAFAGAPGDAVVRVKDSALDERHDSIGATSTDGVIIENTEVATALLNPFSPRSRWSSQGWKTNATAGTQATDLIAEMRPRTGAAHALFDFVWSWSVNGGSYAPGLTFALNAFNQIDVTATGALVASTNVRSSGDVSAGAAGAVYFTGRSEIKSAADNLLTFGNNADTQGVTVDLSTANVWTLKNKSASSLADVRASSYTDGANATTLGRTANIGLGVTSGVSTLNLGNGSTFNGTAYIQFLASNAATNWRVASNNVVAGDWELIPSTAGGGSTFGAPAQVVFSDGGVSFGSNADPGANIVNAKNGFAAGGARGVTSAACSAFIGGLCTAGSGLDAYVSQQLVPALTSAGYHLLTDAEYQSVVARMKR